MEGISLVDVKHESLLQLWRDRVMECRTSGKSVAVWCGENGINIKTYYYWQKQVWNKETQSLIYSGQGKLPQPEPVQFAQVNLGTDSSSDADIVIRKDEWTVEIRNSASPVLLSTVLQAVIWTVLYSEFRIHCTSLLKCELVPEQRKSPATLVDYQRFPVSALFLLSA